MSNNYVLNILQSMSIVAQLAVKNANYDRTVQATIVSCIDPTIGKYKVNYQDGSWFAYSSNTNTSYTPGSNVYVLIPGNDMKNIKTILGTTKQLGINYINTIEETNKYASNGNNTLTDKNVHELCSYKSETKVLYDSGNSSSANSISIDINSTKTYLQKSSHLILEGTVQTKLPILQRYGGNYGLCFYLLFKDNATGAQVTRSYTFDVDIMLGNPYNLINPTTQKAVFEIDGENFIKISKILIFVKNFPNTTTSTKPNDIFISDIKISGANLLSKLELDGIALVLNAPKGYIFSGGNNLDTREINALVRVLGKAIDNNSQKLLYYWFIQNYLITPNDPFYSKHGGQGWKCLNQYKVLSGSSSNPKVVLFNPGTAAFSVKKGDIKAKEIKYKCVVLYEGNKFEKEFIIINNDADYTISVISDQGTLFVRDIGYPTLTCIIKDKNGNEVPISTFKFVWTETNNSGTVSTLADQTNDYNIYNTKVINCENLKKGFNDGTILKYAKYGNTNVTNYNTYINLINLLKTLNKVQYVTQNKIVHLNVKNIINFSTYVCTIYTINNIFIGTASITLVNKATSNGGYSLVINNGTQVFNYDVNGISPCSKSQDVPFVIPALSFTIFDMNGKEVDWDVIKYNSTIEWVLPIKDTMLSVNYTGGVPNAEQTTQTFSGSNYQTFSYKIRDTYAIEKTVNDILLKIKYLGYLLTAKTNFTFTKEGLLGTNGTGFVAKIIPCDGSGNYINTYPMAITTNGTSYTFNFNHLRAQLWHNDENIFSNNKTGPSTQGETVNVTWSILTNTYISQATNKVYDNSSFQITTEGIVQTNTGTNKVNLSTLYTELINNRSRGSTALNNAPANIIRVALTYKNIVHYATLPIITVYKKSIPNTLSNLSVSLVLNTGFRYVVYTEDGRMSQYDNHAPFTLKVTTTLNGGIEDISTSGVSGYSPSYNFGYIGGYYEDGSRRSKVYLLNDNKTGTIPKNVKYVKPADSYDGLSVNNAVWCIVTVSSGIMLIHIPVHFMLNKYGHAALNNWDGNSIRINDSEGCILAPQVGAGRKLNENSFTGILMGEIKKPNNSRTETGLFGYSSGARSIFLDASSGKAVFGVNGKSQIIIDPGASNSANRAYIQSGNFTTNGNGAGMRIDLTDPNIVFGSGHFSVDSSGNITAKGGGTIAGWNISDTDLTKNQVGMSSNNVNENSIAFWAGFPENLQNPTTDAQKQEAISKANFSVTYEGKITAQKGVIGRGDDKIHIGDGCIYTYGKETFSSTKEGFYLGKNGIKLGNAFSVDNKGNMTAKRGYIGDGKKGFTIDSNAIYNGSVSNGETLVKEGIYLGVKGIALGAKSFSLTKDENGDIKSDFATTGPFYVTKKGKMHAEYGDIGGWTLSSNSLRTSETPDSFYVEGSNTDVLHTNDKKVKNSIYIGQAGIRMGRYFHVTREGNLFAADGKIGGWTINSDTLTGGSMTLKSNGSISGTGWSIDASGKTCGITINEGAKINIASGGSLGSGAGAINNGSGYLGSSSKDSAPLSWDNSKVTIGTSALIIDGATIGNFSISNGNITASSKDKKSNISIMTSSDWGGTQIHAEYLTGKIRGLLQYGGDSWTTAPSGTITFSDNSTITVTNGLITSVTKGTLVSKTGTL